MPQSKLLAQNYLSCDILPGLEKLFHDERSSFVVESGKENQDICYYKSKDFTPREREYIAFRISISPELWVDTPSFNSLPFKAFAVGKYFAPKEQAFSLADKIHELQTCHVTVIHDPFRVGAFVAHINAKSASKAQALQRAMQKDGPLIVAGDDYNDVEMIRMGDVKIVMKNGSSDLHPLADILAPPAKEQGIIPALEEAIKIL